MMVQALILLSALLAQDKFEKSAEGIKLPSDDAKAKWSKTSKQHEKVIKILEDRDNWIKALKVIDDKLGFFYEAPKIDVKFEEWEDTQAAYGGGNNGEGAIRFNMKTLSKYQEKIDEFEAMRAEGPVKIFVPPTKIERTVWHELTHCFQDKLKCPDWFREGMASFVEQNASHIRWFAHNDRKLVTLDEAVDDKDMYARGWLFFLWYEETFGAEKVKALAAATCKKGQDWKEAVQEVAKKSWKEIVEAEHAWSAARVKKVKKELQD